MADLGDLHNFVYRTKPCEELGGHTASFSTLKEWERMFFMARRAGALPDYVIGLRAAPSSWPVYPYLPYQDCHYISSVAKLSLSSRCYLDQKTPKHVLCEFPISDKRQASMNGITAGLGDKILRYSNSHDNKDDTNHTTDSSWSALDNDVINSPVPSVICPGGHWTHASLACDVSSACWARRVGSYSEEGESWGAPSASTCDVADDVMPSPLPASYACANGLEHVPYSLVCDFRPDCVDESDEEWCRFPPCTHSQFRCRNQQCVSLSSRCDQFVDCLDASDEVACGIDILGMFPRIYPALVNFQASGTVSLIPLNTSATFGETGACPFASTHFLCKDQGLCLPVYVRCNGVYDCPGRDDEDDCHSRTCGGMYRCRGSSVCLHHSQVCDGWQQCPQHDDERFCHLPRCPPACTCHASIYHCAVTFAPSHHSHLRYLDAKGSGMRFSPLRRHVMLVHLSLARCGLTHLNDLPGLPNLRSIVLSDNVITEVRAQQFSALLNLRHLFLSGNPVTSLFQNTSAELASDVGLTLDRLDLSRVPLRSFDAGELRGLRTVRRLNLSHSGLDHLQPLDDWTELQELDVTGCTVSRFAMNVLRDLTHLHTMASDNPWLCCVAVLPVGFHSSGCRSPPLLVSSCEDLLGETLYRVSTMVIAVVALGGNAAFLVQRAKSALTQERVKFSTITMVTSHLAAADVLMAIHLLIVIAADLTFRGQYLAKRRAWLESAACAVSGALAAQSVTVSVDVILLLSAHAVSSLYGTQRMKRMVRGRATWGVVWATGAAAASVPLLLPFLSSDTAVAWSWRTSVCRPLLLVGQSAPLSATNPNRTALGWLISAGVFVIPNVIASLVTSAAAILVKFHSSDGFDVSGTLGQCSPKQTNVGLETFFLIAANALCRALVVVGFLTSSTASIFGRQVLTAVTLIGVPMTSALDPCLRWIADVMTTRRLEQAKRLRQLLAGKRAGK